MRATKKALCLNMIVKRDVAAQLVVTQPIFTSGFNAAKIREALDRDRAAGLEVEQARRQLIQQVSQAWDELVAQRRAATVIDQRLAAQKVAYDGNRLEEKAGLRSVIDLLNAEAEWSNVRIADVEARHDAYIAGAALLATMGQLEARRLVPAAAAAKPTEPHAGGFSPNPAPGADIIGTVLDQISPRTEAPSGVAPSQGATRPGPVDHRPQDVTEVNLNYLEMAVAEPAAEAAAPPPTASPPPDPAVAAQAELDGSASAQVAARTDAAPIAR
jgi:hypothetical protein